MSASWFARLTLPSQPLGLRLLVLALSIGGLGAAVTSAGVLGYVAVISGQSGLLTAWMTLGAVLLMAATGHAALRRAHRGLGIFLLLAACAVAVVLLFWSLFAVVVTEMLFGGK